jgi:RimJ/RimL family protein N-acetyltransferase
VDADNADGKAGWATKLTELLVGQRELVAEWLLDRIRDNVNLNSDFNAIGVVKDERLIGGVLYHCYRRSDVMADLEIVIAGEPGWLSRDRLNKFFHYPYVDLNCTRTTVVCSKKNRKARKLAERLGYRFEGQIRKAMQDGADAMVYGMLKDECRWLD